MSGQLYSILQTLSKSEIRQFKSYLGTTKRSKYYTKILDGYGKANAFATCIDENIFAMKDKSFQISCKNTFKNKLYVFLTDLQSRNTIQYKVRHLINMTQMLLLRHQINEAEKVLVKAEKIAYNNCFYTLQLKIIDLKLKINKEKSYKLRIYNENISQIYWIKKRRFRLI